MASNKKTLLRDRNRKQLWTARPQLVKYCQPAVSCACFKGGGIKGTVNVSFNILSACQQPDLISILSYPLQSKDLQIIINKKQQIDHPCLHVHDFVVGPLPLLHDPGQEARGQQGHHAQEKVKSCSSCFMQLY